MYWRSEIHDCCTGSGALTLVREKTTLFTQVGQIDQIDRDLDHVDPHLPL